MELAGPLLEAVGVVTSAPIVDPAISGMSIDPLLAAGGTVTPEYSFSPAGSLNAAKTGGSLWGALTGGQQSAPNIPTQPSKKPLAAMPPVSQYQVSTMLNALPPELRQQYAGMFGAVGA